MTNQNNNNNRWIIEVGVIVGTILLAFLIEAWWSDRSEREVEGVVLQSILDELRAKQALLAEGITYNQAILTATTNLLQLAASGNNQVTGTSLDEMIVDIWWYNTESEFESAPLTALFQGGGSTVISNPVLLQKLAEVHVSFSVIRNYYRNDENFHHRTLTPFYIENTNLAQLALSSDHPPGLPDEEYYFPEIIFSTRTDHSDLLSMLEFQSLLAAKMDRQLDILREGYSNIDSQLTETIEMLEDELRQL